MKNIIKYLILTSLFISPIFWSGCDSINKLPLNVATEFPFTLKGVVLTHTEPFCMDDSETYLDYQGEIRALTLLRVIYRTADETNSVIPAELEGTFEVIIRRGDTNETMIHKIIENFKPMDYKKPNKPYNLKLTALEISAVNEFLNSNMQNNPCFIGFVELLDVQNASSDNTLIGTVDVLIEAEVEL